MYALIPILIVAIAAASIIIIIIVVFSALAPVRHGRKVAPPRRAERRFQLLLVPLFPGVERGVSAAPSLRAGDFAGLVSKATTLCRYSRSCASRASCRL